MQWRMVGLFKPQGKEEQLIQGFDSLLKVGRLISITPHWWLRVFCIKWVSRLS